MELDRHGTGKISGWQAAIVLVPLLGVGILGVGGLLAYFATHGKWAAFGVLLAFELAGLVMIAGVRRRSGSSNNPSSQG